MRRLVGVLLDFLDQALREAAADVLVAGHDELDRVDQVIGGALLVQVSRGPRFDGADAQLLLRVNAQHQHGQRGPFASQVPEKVDAGPPGERDVQNDEVPVRVPHQGQRLVGAPGLAADDHVLGIGEDLFQAVSDDRVVIDDQDLLHVRSPLRPGESGHEVGYRCPTCSKFRRFPRAPECARGSPEVRATSVGSRLPA